MPTLTQQDIDAKTKKLSQLITHPEFIKVFAELEAKPAAERVRFMSKNLSPAALVRRGIAVPAGLKITTRYFADPTKDVITAKRVGRPVRGPGTGNVQRPTICISIGSPVVPVCVSIGDEF